MRPKQQYQLPSPTESIRDPWLTAQQIQVDVKRDDLIHPLISGNKYRKLIGHMSVIDQNPPRGLITMGGVWSNHVHAFAYWAKSQNLPCVVLLRGPEPEQPNELLKDISTWDVTIRYLTRTEYRELRLAYEQAQLDSLACLAEFPGYQFIPEGGYHPLAITGMKAMVDECRHHYKAVYVSVGTGTTLGSLLSAWPNQDCQFYGIQAVSADISQKQIMTRLAGRKHPPVTLCSDYQFGGFARVSEALVDFMLEIHTKTGLITEPVYTAKTLYALYDHIYQGYYQPGDKVLFIHTGGLQGLRGYKHTRLDSLCTLAGF